MNLFLRPRFPSQGVEHWLNMAADRALSTDTKETDLAGLSNGFEG
jgi:hypothetical protein